MEGFMDDYEESLDAVFGHVSTSEGRSTGSWALNIKELVARSTLSKTTVLQIVSNILAHVRC
jgi:hypothetical protein